MFRYFKDISEFPRSNYETEDIYKIKGQILEIMRKPRIDKAFQNFTGYQICHQKVSFQCPMICNFIHAISAVNPIQKIFKKFAKKLVVFLKADIIKSKERKEMKIPREIPSMRRTDNSLKEVMTNLCNQKNFRRVFLNQTIPVLSLFANQPTMVLLYFIYNADTNNMIYCTYEDIMQGCSIGNKRTVANTLKTLQETRAIVKISKSHYMLNPALMLQGNNEKFGLLAFEFNDYISLYEKEKRYVSK